MVTHCHKANLTVRRSVLFKRTSRWSELCSEVTQRPRRSLHIVVEFSASRMVFRYILPLWNLGRLWKACEKVAFPKVERRDAAGCGGMREVMSKSGITTVSNILQYQHFQWVSLQNPMPFGQCNLEKTLNTLRSLLGEFKVRLRCLYCTIGSIGFGFYASTSTIYPPSCQHIDANSVVPPLQHWSSIRMPCDPCAIGR